MPSHSTTSLRHTDPNSAFLSTTSTADWIELYSSRPSWKACQISFRKDSEDWVPFGEYQFLDASSIRPGFRAFRVRANRLEFKLANEKTTIVDSNSGRNYKVNKPGRYVVESASGCRRVSDVQIADCLRAIRPTDKYVELYFETPQVWQRCFVTFADEREIDNSTWFRMPMKRGEARTLWFQRLEAPMGITCAFTDGKRAWDSNKDNNYHIRLPGKYVVGGSMLTYCGPAELDLQAS